MNQKKYHLWLQGNTPGERANLRGRAAPIRSATVLCYMTEGMYNVLDMIDYRHEQSNGYIWYMVEPGLWCAQVTGVTLYLPQEPEPEPDPKPIPVPADDKADWQLVYNVAAKNL